MMPMEAAMNRIFLPALLATALSGCASAPPDLQAAGAPLTPEQAEAEQRAGEQVRWGGRIVEVRTEKLRSCFEVVGAPLDASGRPRRVDRSTGRFIACRSGFYEPQVFARGRELTITGRIDGFETRPVGEFDYHYPHVAADSVHLWPKRDEMRYDRDPFFGMGFGYWYDPFWGWRRF
jgi:outer membrane lipoprotein